MLDSFFMYLQNMQWATALRESLVVFPVVEGLHVLGLAISAGFIVMVDLRLVGLGLKRAPFATIFHELEPFSLWGFLLMFVTGILLFCAEAFKMYHSNTFRAKIILLALAGLNVLVFKKTIYRDVNVWSENAVLPPRARFAGWASLILWAGVTGFGRWTAYGLS